MIRCAVVAILAVIAASSMDDDPLLLLLSLGDATRSDSSHYDDPLLAVESHCQDLADVDEDSTCVVDPLSILDGTLGNTQRSARLRAKPCKLPRTSATAPQSGAQSSLQPGPSTRGEPEQLQASSATTSSAGAKPNSLHAALRDIEDSMTLALAQAPIFAKTAASAAARICRQFAGVFSMSSLNKALAEQQASLQDAMLYGLRCVLYYAIC